ncbi:hypothetical protein N7454_001528 [Penicillium verhagenii]|nr:hypothetical protein N7454_001528 [Penicillium verhagenii]
MALTVFDDPKKFDGATTAVTRDHFKQWVATAEQEERSPEFDTERIRIDGYGVQRYRYCIQVTQEILESVIAVREWRLCALFAEIGSPALTKMTSGSERREKRLKGELQKM